MMKRFLIYVVCVTVVYLLQVYVNGTFDVLAYFCLILQTVTFTIALVPGLVGIVSEIEELMKNNTNQNIFA